MIEKLKPTGDVEYAWVDEDGCHHRSKSDYLQINVLGFCGCGDHYTAMVYVRDALQLIADKTNIPENGLTWDEYYKRTDELFSNNEGAKYFLWYFLDQNGFTKHGSSVPGWLTDKGEELLRDINWCIENEKEEE